MELKATSLLLLVCVAIIILSSAGAGTNAIPQCCLTVSKKIPRSMMCNIRRSEIQSRSGRCDIDALILHIGDKKVCAHPRLKKALKKLKKKCKAKPTRALKHHE